MNLYYITALCWLWNLGEAYLDGIESLMWFQSRCQPGPHSSEGLTEPRGSTSKMAHSHGWQAGAGYWQEASVLTLRTSLQGCLSVRWVWWLSPDEVIQEREQVEGEMSCMT